VFESLDSGSHFDELLLAAITEDLIHHAAHRG
jgi:hypothetical protein